MEGTFWCEWFEGRHSKKNKRQQVRCVEGFKKPNTLTKWDKWIRVDEEASVIKKYSKQTQN